MAPFERLIGVAVGIGIRNRWALHELRGIDADTDSDPESGEGKSASRSGAEFGIDAHGMSFGGIDADTDSDPES